MITNIFSNALTRNHAGEDDDGSLSLSAVSIRGRKQEANCLSRLLKDSPIFASNPKESGSRTLLHCNSKSGMHQSFVSCKATECRRTSCQSNPQAVHYIHVCNHICAHMFILTYLDRQILRCVLFSCLVNCHIIQVSNIGCLCVTSVGSFLPTRHHVSNLPRYMNHPAILRPCNCEIDTN